ncbi:MAG TPA: glycoside hydrolase family 3 N-terminal domain-containing protein, partial [Bryobacteraceae bacterium]
RDRIAQLVLLPFYGDAPNPRSEEYRKYLRWVRQLRIGGLVLVNRVQEGRVRSSEPYAMAAFLNRMQRASRLPLIVAGDFERGDSMRIDSKTLFPHAMAFAATRDPDLSRAEGEVTARQGVALGVPWIFAPVADVNNNPDNPIINIRSYGENPEEVAAHVRAFIEGAHSVKSALVTVKHFPGHGDTNTDTHLALAVNNASRERLDSVELVPFRAAIAAGVDSVMSAHIAVPALDDTNLPATLSSAMLTALLRQDLGFRGIISTDALDMAGITKQWPAGQAAVKAIQAGVDVLLMPAGPEDAIDAVVAAVRHGAIPRSRIDQSLRKVLAAKVRLGLDRRRTIDLDRMMDQLDTPEDIAKAQEVAERALTLVRNERGMLPLSPASKPCFVVLTESRGSQQGRLFSAEVRRHVPGAPLVTLDPAASQADLDVAARAAEPCEAILIAAFTSVAAYRGNVALGGGYPAFVDRLIDSGKPVLLISLGNPYLLRAFPKVAAYLATYSTVQPSETAAAKAIFGEIPIQGHLPVTIPGLANYGDGIALAATPASR